MNLEQQLDALAPGELASPAIQRALDEAAGGAAVVIPPGQWRVGVMRLPSGTNLVITDGAVLVASADYADFLAHPTRSTAEQSNAALFYASGATGISIVGPGEIDGSAPHYFAAEPDAFGYRAPARHRPRMVVFEDCRDVRIEDLFIQNAPMWTVHLVSCRGVTVSRLTIDNDLEMPNTDGVNFDSCVDVRMSDCDLSAADDCICVKTTLKPSDLAGPAEDIAITGCTLRSSSCAVKIGTETYSDIRRVTVTDCTIRESNRGIGVFSRDGGEISDLTFSRISFESTLRPPSFWGRADPVFVSARTRDPEIAPGRISHVRFHDLSGHTEGAVNLHAERVGQVRDVTLARMSLVQHLSPSDQQGLYDLRPPVNRANPVGGGLDNAYTVDESGASWGVEAYPTGLPVVFARNIEELHLDEVVAIRPDPLPDGWSREEWVLEPTSAYDAAPHVSDGSASVS